MGKRTWIDSDIWSDTEDLNPTEQRFYLYLLTNEQRNIAGYYKLNLRHAASDMQMGADQIVGLLKRPQKYWEWDEETGQILIPRFTRYNMVKSGQQFKKMNAELNALKPCKLHVRFLKAFEDVNGIGSTELIDEQFRRKTEVYIT